MENKRLIIFMYKGNIQEILSEEKMNIQIINNKTQVFNTEDFDLIEDYEEGSFKCIISNFNPTIDEDKVEFFIDQIKYKEEFKKGTIFTEIDKIIDNVAIIPILNNMVYKDNPNLSFSTPASYFKNKFKEAIIKFKFNDEVLKMSNEKLLELFNKRYRTLITIKKNQFYKLYPCN